MSKPTPIERFGPEWWMLYAAAWQSRWPAARQGVTVPRDGGGTKVIPADPVAIATLATRDADEGRDAFNSMLTCKGMP